MKSIKTLEENKGKIFTNLKDLSKHNTKSRDHKNKGELYKCTHTHHEQKKGSNQQTVPQHTIKECIIHIPVKRSEVR